MIMFFLWLCCIEIFDRYIETFTCVRWRVLIRGDVKKWINKYLSGSFGWYLPQRGGAATLCCCIYSIQMPSKHEKVIRLCLQLVQPCLEVIKGRSTAQMTLCTNAQQFWWDNWKIFNLYLIDYFHHGILSKKNQKWQL